MESPRESKNATQLRATGRKKDLADLEALGEEWSLMDWRNALPSRWEDV